MRTAQLVATKDIRIDTRPDPEPGPDEVVVAVAFCGVCGTDLHTWLGRDSGRPTPLPANLGHETAGTIAAVGSAVEHVAVGDRVTVHPYTYCGTCFYCRSGEPNFCSRRSFLRDGWTDHLTVPASTIYPVPDDLSLEEASLAEPLAACLQAVDVADLRSGVTAVVLGGGPIGLGTLALARASGAARIIVSEPSATRREIATALGATYVLDPTTEDLRSTVLDLTNGIGVEAVFDCVTSSATTAAGISCLRNGGQVVVVGNVSASDRLSLDLDDLHRRQLAIKGTFSRANVFPRTLNWLSRLDLSPMITHTIPLDDIDEAMTLAHEGVAGKVLITP